MTLLVSAVNTHNLADSAAAILAGFTPEFAVPAERLQMIFLDAANIGWADNTQSVATAVTDGAYHTYRVATDGMGTLTVAFDGTPKLSRTGFATNGTLAIGDQTNDANVDSTMRVRSVKRICP